MATWAVVSMTEAPGCSRSKDEEASTPEQSFEDMPPLKAGEKLPPFRLERTDGGIFDSQRDVLGKVTLFSFWATWCVPCRTEMYDLQHLVDEYGPQGFQVLAVNVEAKDLGRRDCLNAISRYRTEYGLPVPAAIEDGSVSKLFRVSGIPTLVMLDHHGVVRYVHRGRMREQALVYLITDLLRCLPGD